MEVDFESETFGFLPLMNWMLEAKCFASFTPNNNIYILWTWKREVSLPTAHWLFEAKRFASLTPNNNMYIVGVEANLLDYNLPVFLS